MLERERPEERTYKIEEWCGGTLVTDMGLNLVYYGFKAKGGMGWVLLTEGNSPLDEDATLTPEAGQQLSAIAQTAFATTPALESPKN